MNTPHVAARKMVRRSHRRRLSEIAAIAVLATGALTVMMPATGAFAAARAPAQAPSDDGELSARLERACLRIPNLQLRTDALLAKIGGDADTRGSLLWLDARIADAEAEGRTQRVDVLTNRRAVRAQSVAVLEQRQAKLAELAAVCADKGVVL